jgi:purine-binding chemotaxis protein CheW
MRPLRVELLPGAPAFVLGVAIIRGSTVPVLDASQLLGSTPGHDFERFVTLRVRERLVALAVAGVVGICTLSRDVDAPLPPLLRDATTATVQALRVLDHELLWVLESANVLPEPVLASLADLARLA